MTGDGSYPVTRKGSGSTATLKAQLRPNLAADLTDQALFDETVFHLGRSLNKSNIRTIALEPGSAKRPAAAPKTDAVTKIPLVDEVDPDNLSSAFASIRGQTALVVGRVENGKVVFSPSKGPEISRDIEELISSASRNDVNLVILETDAGRQPGGRNWLWQIIEVGGLKDASKAATVGDFLDALAARRGGFQLQSSRDGYGRIQIAAKSVDASSGVASSVSNALEETVGHVTGEIVTKAAEIHSRDQSAELELDGQLIPGVPTYIQIPYLVSLVAGVLSWATVRGWWRRIWPVAEFTGPQSRGGRALRNLPRELVFFLLILPIFGIPALLWQFAVQTWASVTAPFRWFHRRFLRREV